MYHYPSELAITPLTRNPNLTVSVPGSKSITNRALVLAALTTMDGELKLAGALRSEDTEVMVEALKSLGYDVRPHWDDSEPSIIFPFQERPRVPTNTANLFVANFNHICTAHELSFPPKGWTFR